MKTKKNLTRGDERGQLSDELRVAAYPLRLAKAQQLIRKHVAPTISLADELIVERCGTAGSE
jgi:hypothetical protein